MERAEGPLHDGDAGSAADLMGAEVRALAKRVGELERQVAAMSAGAPTAEAVPPPPLIRAAVAAGAGSTVLGAGVARTAAVPAAMAARVEVRRAPGSSLESRIGSQVFNRVGVVALLLAAAWFLKLAIANGWIGPVGRVLVGLVAGAGLVLWSERFSRRGFAAFSYSLKAVGTSVLYLALWAAFQLYHLVPAAVALGAMLLVTAWNGWMAWAQDAELLGGYALAGAMATPKLLATGESHELFLFTYLLLADAMAVLLVRAKGWVRLLPWVFAATVVYYVGWYSSYFRADALDLTAMFAVLLFAVFLVPVFVPEVVTEHVTREWAAMVEVVLPLADAAFLALAMSAMLERAGHHAWLPWLMVALAALYLGLMRLPQAAVTAGVHLSLAVVFLTIAIPLKATGDWITVAWLVEGVALVALGMRAGAAVQGRLLRGLGCGALLLGWMGAMWRVFTDAARDAFVNARFGTAVVGLAAMAGVAVLARRLRRDAVAGMPKPAEMAAASVIAFNVLAIAAVIREISALWRGGTTQVLQRSLAISGFLMVYGAGVLAVGFWRRSAFVRWQGLVLLSLTIAKIFVWDTRDLSEGYRIASFLGLGVLLMAVSFAYQKDWLALREHGMDAGETTMDDGA